MNGRGIQQKAAKGMKAFNHGWTQMNTDLNRRKRTSKLQIPSVQAREKLQISSSKIQIQFNRREQRERRTGLRKPEVACDRMNRINGIQIPLRGDG